MRATKIRMNDFSKDSNDLAEIDSIFLEGCAEEKLYSKSIVYDFLIAHPNSIYVDIAPFPYLEPVMSSKGEKYVRSRADYTDKDNLLSLPRI